MLTSKADELGDRLKSFMQEHDMTQEKLSRATGLPVTQISHYCCGRRYPSYYNLTLMLNALCCEPDEVSLIVLGW